jgi:cysteine synthase A
LTPKEKAVAGAVAKAQEIIDGLPDGQDGYMLQQFENPANAKIHRDTTGPEIWEDTDGSIDIFVSGVGTGGTVTGVSQFIKGSAEHGLAAKKAITTIAVEPQEQMLLTAAKGGEKIGAQGPHKIQGMGAGFIPAVVDLDMIDEVIAVHSDQAMETTNRLWMMGLPVGVSSGAIVAGAVRYCQRPEAAGKLAVAIIPSFGERYFTHPMFADMKAQAEGMTKQPLPEPFDNTEFGFATPRG